MSNAFTCTYEHKHLHNTHTYIHTYKHACGESAFDQRVDVAVPMIHQERARLNADKDTQDFDSVQNHKSRTPQIMGKTLKMAIPK